MLLTFLTNVGPRYGVEAIRVPRMEIEGITISSSSVRRAVEGGDIALARTLLGRPYSLCGTVVRGKTTGPHVGIPYGQYPGRGTGKTPAARRGVCRTGTRSAGGLRRHDEYRDAPHGGRLPRAFDRGEPLRLRPGHLRTNALCRDPRLGAFRGQVQLPRQPQAAVGQGCPEMPGTPPGIAFRFFLRTCWLVVRIPFQLGACRRAGLLAPPACTPRVGRPDPRLAAIKKSPVASPFPKTPFSPCRCDRFSGLQKDTMRLGISKRKTSFSFRPCARLSYLCSAKSPVSDRGKIYKSYEKTCCHPARGRPRRRCGLGMEIPQPGVRLSLRSGQPL